MGKVTTVGIDLAKVNGNGQVVLRKTVSRARVMEVVAQLQPCLIGMEACSGAHEWARQIQSLGHDVRIMAPRFVAPYRRSRKNDSNDAEAICEAVQRPSMRFVPVKSAEQQAVLTVHRVRLGFVATNDRGPGVRLAFGPGATTFAS
jgi:transposase